jgi:hypothetical protein
MGVAVLANGGRYFSGFLRLILIGYERPPTQHALLASSANTCMMYVNMLMIRRVLAERQWAVCLKKEELRPPPPVIYGHFKPYGSFRLDVSARLVIDSVETKAT